MNHIALLGSLVNEPELKLSKSGQKYLKNAIAVWRPNSAKERIVDNFTFFAFDKTAEFISRYVKKNGKLLIQGSMQNNVYKDKDGNERRAFEVMVEKAEFGLKDLPTT